MLILFIPTNYCLRNLPISICLANFCYSLQEQETVQGATMLLSDLATHEAIEMDFVQFQVVPWSWSGVCDEGVQETGGCSFKFRFLGAFF